MTDLGNGLFAIKVDKDTYGYENWNDELFYKMSEWSSGSKLIGFSFEILGTVTKLKIDFDYKTETGLGTFDFYELLSSKGLYFENPCVEPNKSDFRSTYDCAFHRYNWKEPYEKAVEKWQQAQNNLIEKLVIIKKV